MSPADRKCTDQMRWAVFQGVNTIEMEPLVRGSIDAGCSAPGIAPAGRGQGLEAAIDEFRL
jgi:hypothetical protein